MSKTYFVRTYGCQMNEHDSERIAGLLELNGYVRASDAESADLVLFNTCAIRENADNRLYGTLGHMKALKDERPELRIAVGGCQVQKDKALVLEKAPWVDVAFGTFSVGELPRLLAERETTGAPSFEFAEQTDTFPSALPARRADAFHAWVSVSVGCDNACTFCIVPYVRGPQVSRRLGDVLDEARRLVDDGVVEISLLGQNVNTYGRDLDGRPMFADLLRALAERGLRGGRTASRALGYQQVLSFLDGETTEDEAVERTISATRRFARRQDSWFRKDPRITWVSHDDPGRVEVLTEGPSKKDRSRTTTRTRTNKIVHVPGELSAGTFVDVVIRDGHPHHLEGILA